MVKFESTDDERQLMEKIADRVHELGITYQRMDLLMDLSATNSNGCPLDFQKLLDAPPFDFMHDIRGIQAHINRKTGELGDCFLPRCSRTESDTHDQDSPKAGRLPSGQ